MRRGILATRDELTLLRDRIARKPYDTIYDRLHKRCNLILASAPITEAQWRAMWEQGSWGAALLAARTTQGRILDLLIAHHIDPNRAYRDHAIEELKNIIGWSTWVDPCHPNLAADLCTAESAVAATVGLDWLWEDLTEADRLRVVQAIRHKALEPYHQGVRDGAFWYDCYHNWNAVVNSGCGLAALALADEEPAAQEALHLAETGLQHFFNALGREGGWDEGTGYWGYAVRYLVLFAEARARLLDDRKILHARGMDATGLFPVYFTPHGQAASFGDAPGVPLCGALYLLVKYYGQRGLTWWLDTYSFHRDVSTTGWSAAGLALLFRPVDVETPKTPDLADLKVFHEIGWAAMADRWPRPGMYVAAKTGDLSASHAQRDMNSIQLQVDGEMLLTDPGSGQYSHEYFSERRGEFYEVQARAHNTITFAERDHQIDAQGSIIEAQSAKDYHWLACDAGSACGDSARFIRHLVMVVQPQTRQARMLVVLDELESGVPETIDLYWHTRGEIELHAGKKTGHILGQGPRLDFAIVSTCPGSLKTLQHNADNILHLSGGLMGRGYLLSVFSREKISGKVLLKPAAAGGVRVKVSDTRLLFKGSKRHLQLDKVVLQ